MATTRMEKLHRLVEKSEKNNSFSGGLIVSENDSVIYSAGIGYADIEKKVLNDTSTIFNIASVGKLFTQILILQLLEREKLNLDDKLSKFFSSFNSDEMRDITIFHLLDHRSGLDDVYVHPEYIAGVRNNIPNFQDQMVKLISQEKLGFEPGEERSYSNSGYYLLGALASHIEGKSLADLMKERIFAVLDMNNSGSALNGDFVEGQAKPYKKNWLGKPKEVTITLPGDPPSGAGSQFASTADLYRFYQSILNDNRLLKDSTKSLIFNHYKAMEFDSIKHSGWINGYVGGTIEDGVLK
ncbi:MAG: beta-lactamase family protein [Saprospiraceae bacterium]|nr:beta-lactamase family protein [Saprospiraceae bacterium]